MNPMTKLQPGGKQIEPHRFFPRWRAERVAVAINGAYGEDTVTVVTAEVFDDHPYYALQTGCAMPTTKFAHVETAIEWFMNGLYVGGAK